MNKQHHYALTIQWTGNNGQGTAGYTAYQRSHTITADNKPELHASSDPAFRGDKTKYNPEDMLVASIASCHMLWYLHLCADAGIIVTAYTDNPTGIMEERPDGGRFTNVTLHPVVSITDAQLADKAIALHEEAHAKCFIANSVNFPVHHKPEVRIAELSAVLP